jgi:formylglycine-generating enzyme required for sulfatase activity
MYGCKQREDAAEYIPPAAMSADKIQAAADVATKNAFRDCENCPRMVTIPAGEFMMGSRPGEVAFVANQGPPIQNSTDLSDFLTFKAASEQPQHRFVLARPFAVSQFVITSRQFADFFQEWKNIRIRLPLGCTFIPFADDNFRAGERSPAQCTDWPDAIAYVEWLSTKTGRKYRLLTESEWEYVARAGTATPFYWGSRNDMACQYANAADLGMKKGMPLVDANTCDNGISFNFELGRFKPNAFGLYDIVGNLKQWVQDCDNPNYTKAPVDGSAWMTGDCSKHMVRGGYWRSHPLDLRSASRTSQSATDADDMTFRVAAELDKGDVQVEQTATEHLPVHQLDPSQSSALGATFRDCPNCPEMVVLPSGQFEMAGEEHTANSGSSAALPRRIVTIAKPFAIGKFSVTQHEWFALMGTLPPGDPSCHDCPVAYRNWFAAKDFVKKLSQQTGNVYRLPSEAEWEYACRAGVKQTYCGSDDLDRVAWHFKNSNHWVHPVGQKAPNAWGLYDMTGNVEQWVEDCNHFFFDKTPAPIDGSAWTTGPCETREYRGGSFLGFPDYMQAVSRQSVSPDAFEPYKGFRVVRELPEVKARQGKL